MKLISTIKNIINEKVFARMQDSLDIFYQLDNTIHTQRDSKGRHLSSGGDKIYDLEILSLLEKAKPQITSLIGTDEIQDGQTIVVSEKKSPFLNVVIACEKYSVMSWKLKVITVMRKEGFRPKRDSLVININ